MVIINSKIIANTTAEINSIKGHRFIQGFFQTAVLTSLIALGLASCAPKPTDETTETTEVPQSQEKEKEFPHNIIIMVENLNEFNTNEIISGYDIKLTAVNPSDQKFERFADQAKVICSIDTGPNNFLRKTNIYDQLGKLLSTQYNNNFELNMTKSFLCRIKMTVIPKLVKDNLAAIPIDGDSMMDWTTTSAPRSIQWDNDPTEINLLGSNDTDLIDIQMFHNDSYIYFLQKTSGGTNMMMVNDWDITTDPHLKYQIFFSTVGGSQIMTITFFSQTGFWYYKINSNTPVQLPGYPASPMDIEFQLPKTDLYTYTGGNSSSTYKVWSKTIKNISGVDTDIDNSGNTPETVGIFGLGL